MLNYYLTDLDGNITCASIEKFDENCLITEENIVRDASSGILYLESDYLSIIQSSEYIANKKTEQIETLTGQYAADKCERMISWVSTFISSISTATSLDDIKVKANAFKTKLATLQTDYANKCTEVENG